MADSIINTNQDAGTLKPKSLADLTVKYIDELAAGITPSQTFTEMADEFFAQFPDPQESQPIRQEVKAKKRTSPTPSPKPKLIRPVIDCQAESATSKKLFVSSEFMAQEVEEAKKAGVLTFIPRIMTQVTMPHSDPKSRDYVRKNGNFLWAMWSPHGLPYGPIPRLILSWAATEVAKTGQRMIDLGDCQNDFLRRLGLDLSGGMKGGIARLKNQFKRLLSCAIVCDYEDYNEFHHRSFSFAEEADILWWKPVEPDQKKLWNSTITLSERFANEVIGHPVPIRMSTMEALRGSSFQLDIYYWLTHKNFYSTKVTYISWESLQEQFGAGYPTTSQGKRDFKKKFLEALKKVAAVYSEAGKLREEGDYLVYVPGRPDVQAELISG